MNVKLKKLRKRIIISLIIFMCAIALSLQKNNIMNIEIIQLLMFLLAYLVVCFDIVKKAITNIFHGHIFDENFLMTLATVAAFITGEYPEGVMVMWLYQVGELFQKYAVGKSRKSITELMNIRPDYANLEKNGELIEVSPEEVGIEDIIIVKPGEKIPLDGIVQDGESQVDTMALTGEATPRKVNKGTEVFSGCINKNGLLKIKVTKKFEESTVSKILELVENASSRKAKSESFISKFAKYYTPIIVILAMMLAIIPPLIIKEASFIEYIHRACSFLVISCPCALVISIPLGFFGGIGGASKLGILIKGSNYLEMLAKAKTVVFDKTGTLTKGSFEVTEIVSMNGMEEEKLLEIAALAESYSNHPIAISIKNAYQNEIDINRVAEAKEIEGKGISVKVDGKQVCVGNHKLMEEMHIEYVKNEKSIGTVVYIAIENEYAGYINISDEIKEDVKDVIENLKKKTGIKDIVMLTGDNKEVAHKVGEILNINKVYAELLPNNKVEEIEKLLENKPNDTSLVFVGDGINDAPVLTRADIGIAMGGLGSDAAIEAADIVIMDDNISKISTAIELSKRTLRIVKQNIIFALLVKFIVLILGAYGMADMWEAVFADVGVSFIAILNSMRAMNVRKFKR